MVTKVTDSIIYVGANDHDIDLFEGMYKVPNGMAYNSYVIVDDFVAVMDTIDIHKTEEWLGNIEEALGGRGVDYLVVQHMEPDHSASIKAFVEKYPNAQVVGNVKTFNMIAQFFPDMVIENKKLVADGDSIDLGQHKLNFVFAPMVHWPEVMVTYESTDKVLFTADGFGKFGALDVEDDDWACEARRYYFGIVGKYGNMVQNLLKKVVKLDVQCVCPLHGPVLKENLAYYFNLYNTWSAYKAESKGVCVCYTSVYGNTKQAAELLCRKLEEEGVPKVVCTDLARCDMSEAVEDAFRYDTLVLATTTYNADMFPFMRTFIENLVERGYKNRKLAFIENGSWAPMAMKAMKEAFKNSVGIEIAENNITIKSALNAETTAAVEALAKELASAYKEEKPAEKAKKEEKAAPKKKFVCKICGYVYEGDELPADYVCPLCKQGADMFEEKPIEDAKKEEKAAPKKKFVCKICGYVYEGDELPADYVCPLCKQGADMFEEKLD